MTTYLRDSSTGVLSPAPLSLLPGIITVVSGLTAANFVADAASQANWFSVPGAPGGGDRTVTFRPNCDGVLTTGTANLESSDDGGVTWSVYPNGATMTFSALAQVQILHIVGGLIYRVNWHSLTFGTGGTTLNVNAAVS